MNSRAAFAQIRPTVIEEVSDQPHWVSVTPLPTASLWLIEALRRIRSLSELKANWDGYGSPSLSEPAVAAVVRLLKALEHHRPEMPTIRPVPGGGLQMDWHFKDRELEIEIFPEGNVQFLAISGDQEFEDALPLGQPEILRTLVNWLAR